MSLSWFNRLVPSARAVKPALPRQPPCPPLPATLSRGRVLQMLAETRHVETGQECTHWCSWAMPNPPSDEPWPYTEMLRRALTPSEGRGRGAQDSSMPRHERLYLVFDDAEGAELGVAWTRGDGGMTFAVRGEALHTDIADFDAVQDWNRLFNHPANQLVAGGAPPIRSLPRALAFARAAAPEELRQLLPPGLRIEGTCPEEPGAYSYLESLRGWPEPSRLAAQLAQRVPEALTRARLLLRWYGHGAGPWGRFPAYEQLALQLLRRQSRLTIMCAISVGDCPQDELRGGMRYLLNPATRRDLAELAKLPPRLKVEALNFADGHGDPYTAGWARAHLYGARAVGTRWAPEEYVRRWARGSSRQRTEDLWQRIDTNSLSTESAALLRHLGAPAAEHCAGRATASATPQFRRVSTSIQGWMERLARFGAPAVQRAALALARANISLCPQSDGPDPRSLLAAAEACVLEPCGPHTEVLVAALHANPSATWAGSQATAPQFALCTLDWAARCVVADTVEYAVSALDAALAARAASQLEGSRRTGPSAARDEQRGAEAWARGVVRAALEPWALGFHDPLRG